MKNLLIRVILLSRYGLLMFSYFFPRNKRIWCFGSSFDGNSKYLFIYMVNHMASDYHCVWIGEKEDVKHINSLGLESYYRWSLKGLYYSLRGGVYVYNSYPANVNLFTMGGAKLVNLWHGVALKCIDRQIKAGPTAKYYQAKGLVNKLKYLNFRKHADIVLSTSPLMTENFSEAFDVPPSNIIESIYPRCYLFDKTEEEIKAFVNKYENKSTSRLIDHITTFNYVYVYMPTWRDTGDDFLSQCGFDLNMINKVMLNNNSLFIIKMHPDSKLKIDAEYKNILVVDKNVDIYPVLPFTDCLITDFSSIYFDYILMKHKDIILFLPDYDDYINKNRDLKYPYDDVMKGIKVMDFESLLRVMEERPHKSDIQGLQAVIDKFWDYKCGSMDEIVKAISVKFSIN